jgi:anti-sigma B factor antagonist
MRIPRECRTVIRLAIVPSPASDRNGECGLEELQLSSERRGASLVVAIRGDLDLTTGRQFDEYLTSARVEHDHIVLDLSLVDFLDTSSLAVIVGHWKAMQAAGGTLVLAGARYRYTKSLWITGLADRLPFYDTVDKAVAAGKQQAETARQDTPS